MNADTVISRNTKPAGRYELSVATAIQKFSAPSNLKIQLLRPFAVFSTHSYSAPLIPPIGVAYIGGILEAAGYSVEIIDAIGEGIESLRKSTHGDYNEQGLSVDQIIDRIDPDCAVLGISTMFSQEWVPHRELIKAIKNKFPSMTIVVGGEHVTAMPEYVLNDCTEIEYAVCGEGELSMLQVANKIFRGERAENVAGVWHRSRDGRPKSGSISLRINDVDNLPWPAWHMVDLNHYFNGTWAMGINLGRNLPILATRGCPYQCTFCSSPTMWTTRYIMRSAKDVVDEIEQLIEQYNISSFDFADLTAIVKKKWILEFCEELNRRKILIAWQLPTGTRSEALDEETLQAIYDSGCKLLVFSPESGSAETLKAIKKKIKLKNFVTSLRHAVRIGHTVKLNFVIGFPGESRFNVLKTIWFLYGLAIRGAHDCNISIFTPYPGSQLFWELVDSGKLPSADDKYFNDLIVQFDFTIPNSYTETIGGIELSYFRIFGMGGFYLLTYITRPRRIWRLVKGALSRNLTPSTLFEQRVSEMIARSRLKVNIGSLATKID